MKILQSKHKKVNYNTKSFLSKMLVFLKKYPIFQRRKTVKKYYSYHFVLQNAFLLLSILMIFNFASAPKDLLLANSKKTKSTFKSNQYIIVDKQFQFLLRKGEKVRFIITPPHYGVRTAIGVATDGSAEKIKVLVYKLNNKQDQEGELINATMDKEEYHFWELEQRAYYYMIEIQMLASSGGEYGSYVELVHGFKDIPKENPTSDFRYHTNEGEKPTGELAPPCLMPERHFSCTPNEKGYIHRIE